MSLNVYQILRKKEELKKTDLKKHLLYIAYNQTLPVSHFVCGLESGFRVYCLRDSTVKEGESLAKEEAKMNFTTGGVGVVEMLNRSNIIALVGGGTNPAFPRNKVILWDQRDQKVVGEIVCPRDIHGIKVNTKCIVAVSLQNIYVYDWHFKLLHSFATCENPLGTCVISSDPEKHDNIIAFPGPTKGTINVHNLTTAKKIVIKAHESQVTCIALSRDCKKIVSASERGTLIKIFDTVNGEKIREFRRGSTWAEIYSIAISDDSKFVCCSSDKGTIHLFSIITPKSSSFLSYITSYDKSVAQYKGTIEGHSLCSFGEESTTVTVVTSKGQITILEFNVEKGEVKAKTDTFLKDLKHNDKVSK